MVISVSLKKEYVPTWMNNNESEKPFKVLHRAPTMGLYEELIPKPKIKMRVDKDGANGGETEMTVDTTNIVKRMVIEIVDLTLNLDDGSQMVIKNVDDLFGKDAPAMLSGLTEELGRYLQELLTTRGVNSKN